MVKRKYVVLISMLAMVLIIALAGCGKGQSTGSKEQSSQGGTIKVGYIAALSGNSADMGEPGRKGIQMAIDEANAAGGVNGQKVELVALDDEADPAKSVTQAQKLITQEKVVAVIGGPNSGTVLANREPLSEAGIPEIVAIGTVDSLIDSASPTFKTMFSTTAYDSYMINLMASYVKSKGYSKVGIIADNGAYGQASVKTVKKIFGEKSIPIVAEVSHQIASTDLTSQALTLKNAGADCVYVYSLGPDAALFMKTIKQLNWPVPTIGGRGLNMAAFTNLAGTAGDGIVIPSDCDPDKKEMKEFISKYSQKYGETPNYMFPALGYDTARVVIEGLKKSGGKGGQDLVKALEGINNFPSTVGQPGHYFSFSPTKHKGINKGADILLVVKEGKFVLFDEHPPEN
ncbi:MAG: ABC transporter substrate-binding protein [Eubacteriales bacterium]